MIADSPASLTAQQKHITRMAALTAVGNIELLKPELTAGLEAGLTVGEIQEVLVQLYAYCGFPRSLNALNAFMAVLEARKSKGIADAAGRDATPVPAGGDRYETGRQTLRQLTGRDEKAPAGVNAFAPVIDRFLKEHLFADIFSRDVLSHGQRELVTIAALAAMTGVAPQLQAHIGMGMNTGITAPQLAELFSMIEHTIGPSEAAVAREALSKASEGKK